MRQASSLKLAFLCRFCGLRELFLSALFISDFQNLITTVVHVIKFSIYHSKFWFGLRFPLLTKYFMIAISVPVLNLWSF